LKNFQAFLDGKKYFLLSEAKAGLSAPQRFWLTVQIVHVKFRFQIQWKISISIAKFRGY
jgi:hypothetical protein